MMTDQNDTPASEAVDEGAPARSPAKLALVAAVVVALAGGAWYLYSQGKLPGVGGKPAPAVKAAPAPSLDGTRVLAEVNGKTITAEEIAPDVNQGVDRAVAVDRYVTRLLAAEAANEMYPEAAKVAKAAAEREVLSNLYINRRGQELVQAVTQAEIDRFYKEQVRDADYASYKLNAYLTRDQIDAATMERNLLNNDAEAKGRFQPLSTQGDGFIPLSQVPQGLGPIVASLQPGQYTRALQTRDGFLILQVEQVRPGKKPAQDKTVNDQIRRLIATQRFNAELAEKRQKAQIKLKL